MRIDLKTAATYNCNSKLKFEALTDMDIYQMKMIITADTRLALDGPALDRLQSEVVLFSRLPVMTAEWQRNWHTF